MQKKKTQKTEKKDSHSEKNSKRVGKEDVKKKKTRVEEGEIIGKKGEEKVPFWKEREATCSKFAGSCFAVFFLIIFVILLNTKWDSIGFLNDDFTKWLPFANVALGVSIATHLFLIFFSNKILRSAIQIPMDIMNIVSTFALYSIYPFDISSDFLNTLFKISLIFVIIATIIGLIVRGVKVVAAIAKTSTE